MAEDTNNQNNNGGQNSKRGFAGMPADRQREIASQGGKAAHASGRANTFDSDSARRAGKIGGQNRAANAANNNNGAPSGETSGMEERDELM
jgi:uncharacterized protein